MGKYIVKVYINGSRQRRLEGMLHRDDGPAIEWSDGSKEWRFNGDLHRVDGPAIVYIGSDNKWWYFYGKSITEEDHRELVSERI